MISLRAKTYGRGTGIPHPIDVHVGKRIRMRRLFLGMNQKTYKALGLTFQQVQKYECSASRVSASRLSAMADILGVPISFFFGDLQLDDAVATPAERHLMSAGAAGNNRADPSVLHDPRRERASTVS